MSGLSEIVKRYNSWGWKYFFIDFYEYKLKYKYSKYIPGELAMKKMLDDYSFETVLDVGCGDGAASLFFKRNGKVVTACDYGRSVHFEDNMADDVIIGDFNTLHFDKQYDALWCSHVLEHQLNVQQFLEKINSLILDGGVLGITVPRMKNEIVGGHVSLWNPGLLLYRLVLAGFDCSEASVLCYGYNISVVVKKKTISILNELSYDRGDLKIISRYLPKDIKSRPVDRDISFNGNFKKINW